MKWVRSYVSSIEETVNLAKAKKRAFVYDPHLCEPFFADGHNYWDMFVAADDDILLVEWDIALSKEDRRLFETYCRAKNDSVHVAPFHHYYFRNHWQNFSYVHRNSANLSVREYDPYCFYFGFGLVYLPLKMMKDYVQATRNQIVVKDDRDRDFRLGADYPDLASDCTFSYWHASVIRQPVPIHWDVRPVHLHYEAAIYVPSEPRA